MAGVMTIRFLCKVTRVELPVVPVVVTPLRVVHCILRAQLEAGVRMLLRGWGIGGLSRPRLHCDARSVVRARLVRL